MTCSKSKFFIAGVGSSSESGCALSQQMRSQQQWRKCNGNDDWFVIKKNWVKWDWKTMQSNEVHDLYCSLNIIQVIKTRMMRWAGNVSCLGGREERYIQGFRGGGKPEINRPL
jgi:hypothetical protein